MYIYIELHTYVYMCVCVYTCVCVRTCSVHPAISMQKVEVSLMSRSVGFTSRPTRKGRACR